MGASNLDKVVPVYMFTDGLMCGCVGSSHAFILCVCARSNNTVYVGCMFALKSFCDVV